MITAISIHAPSRERLTQALHFKVQQLFQSTLPRGSDCVKSVAGSSLMDFNPRSLAGATNLVLQRNSALVFQSTLPRGSDVNLFLLLDSCKYFNPRSLAGATVSLSHWLNCVLFQSTLPRGSDGPGCVSLGRGRYFNPRSLAGATEDTAELAILRLNFNPRSLAGATISGTKFKTLIGISIHAPSRERPMWANKAISHEVFQSTLPRGSDCFLLR